jgi:hypothetical protein
MMTVNGKLIKVNTTVKSAILQREEIHEPTTLPRSTQAYRENTSRLT